MDSKFFARRYEDTPIDAVAAMEVDGAKTTKKPKKKVEKRRGKKSSIVFPMRGPKKNKK